MQLEDRVALVTGAASGIGRAVVAAYLKAGAKVVGFDRATPAEPSGDGDRYRHFRGDVTCSGDNRLAVAEAEECFGRLDILVANAGIYDGRFPFAETDVETLRRGFDQVFSVNVLGYMLGVHAALPALRKTRGTAILTSSISGHRAGFGGALYVAAKHAVNGLTRQLALELAPEVRVNAIAPGYIETDLGAVKGLAAPGPAPQPDPRAMHLGIVARPADLAAAYLFLAGEGARTMTGSILEIDGGSALRGPRPAAPPLE